MNLYPSGTYNGCNFAILLSCLLLLVHGIQLTEGFSSFLWSKSSSLSSSAPPSSWNNNLLEPHRPHRPERRHRTVGYTTTVSPRPRNNQRLGHSTLAFTATTAALLLQEEEEAGWTGTVVQQDTRSKMEYVESYEEQRLRLWWELDPFSIASDIVNSVLLLAPTTTTNNSKNNNDNHGCTIPLLHRLDGTSFYKETSSFTSATKSTGSMATGYEDLFHVLYSSPLNINNTLDNHDGKNIPVEKVTTKPNEKVQQHFALTMAYRGDDFCGWQRQPNNMIQPSVQATVEDSLQSMLIQFQEQQQLQQQQLQPTFLPPPRVDVRVCGRTDAGVHALAQVCRFRTTFNISMDQIQTNLSLKFSSAPTKVTSVEAVAPTVEAAPLLSLGLKCTHIRRVSKNFHPTFGATCRAYTYLMDIDWKEEDSITTTTTNKSATTSTSTTTKSTSTSLSSSTSITLTTRQIQRLNQMLEYLQDQELDYFAMSYGKLKTQTSNCTLYHAKACLVQYCATTTERPRTALCIELVGNRFLRRMVRILVSTALQLAVQENDHQSNNNPSNEDPARLYHVLQTRDRSVTAKPAPPKGYCDLWFHDDIPQPSETSIPMC
jgi:tRNA pseudouridine(38-40) synthase